ncbi:MAG: Asp23/Gls24 family envelope stress response protein [bacterium]
MAKGEGSVRIVHVMADEMGKIFLTREALAKIAGIACTECYGVVGMAKRTPGELIGSLLGIENVSQGVQVRIERDEVHLTLFVILLYGIRISEVIENIREQVKYRISSMTHLNNFTLDVVVCHVKDMNNQG